MLDHGACTLYLKKLPHNNEKTNDIFYLKPLASHPSKPWFANVRVGKNKLNTMVKRMCEAAGLPPRTNHSLRVTGATTLFTKNVPEPEKLVQEVTGHRSLECLRQYEKTTEQNQRAVSKCLSSGSQYNPLIGGKAEPSNSSTGHYPSNALQLNHTTMNSSTAQPIHRGIPIAIPNYGTIQSVVINVYNSDNNGDNK